MDRTLSEADIEAIPAIFLCKAPQRCLAAGRRGMVDTVLKHGNTVRTRLTRTTLMYRIRCI